MVSIVAELELGKDFPQEVIDSIFQARSHLRGMRTLTFHAIHFLLQEADVDQDGRISFEGLTIMKF